MGQVSSAIDNAKACFARPSKTKPVQPETPSGAGLIEPPAAPKSKSCCNKSCCGKCCLWTTIILAIVVPAGYYGLPYVPPFWADLEGSSSAVPIVIYCERTVKDTAKYKEVWTPFAEYTQVNGPGVLAMFSFMDQKKEKRALQFYMFSDLAGFASQPKDKPELSSNLWAEYAGTKETDFCQVYGGWDDSLKAVASQLPGVQYYFGKGAGFIRSVGSEGYGYEHADKIMVMVSKRPFRQVSPI